MIFTGCADVIMKETGLVEDEEFNIITSGGVELTFNPYKFHKGLLLDKDGDKTSITFGNLIIGVLTIKKIPFIPKAMELYYRVVNDVPNGYTAGCVNNIKFIEMLVDRGIKFFRTEQEAIDEVKRLGWEVH